MCNGICNWECKENVVVVVRSDRRCVEIEVGKNITRHYLPKGLTILFLLSVIAILVNELLRKMIKYQVIIFTQRIRQAKASFPRRSACCC